MTDPDGRTTGGARAADLYTAALVPRPGGRVLRGARLVAAFAAEMAGASGPSLHDVVVTRRTDGAEVARVPVPDPTVPGNTLGRVRQQLADLGPAAFLDRWDGEDPPG